MSSPGRSRLGVVAPPGAALALPRLGRDGVDLRGLVDRVVEEEGRDVELGIVLARLLDQAAALLAHLHAGPVEHGVLAIVSQAVVDHQVEVRLEGGYRVVLLAIDLSLGIGEDSIIVRASFNGFFFSRNWRFILYYGLSNLINYR